MLRHPVALDEVRQSGRGGRKNGIHASRIEPARQEHDRTADAMMTMKKIDVAAIKAARLSFAVVGAVGRYWH